MLGTNELKTTYNKTAIEIGKILEEKFVKTILNYQSQIDQHTPQLVIIAPPIVDEHNSTAAQWKYTGATKKSQDLNSIYQDIAARHSCHFLSNAGLQVGPDGVHLTEESHHQLAESLAKIIKDLHM